MYPLRLGVTASANNIESNEIVRVRTIDEDFSQVYSSVKEENSFFDKVDFSSPRIDEKISAILMN